MTKKKMWQRMIWKALAKRRSRVAVALLAIAIGTAVISALLNVYLDIQVKMSKELRTYGANLVLAPAGTGENSFTTNQLKDVLEIFGDQVVGAAPNLYGVVNNGKYRMVMVGTDFTEVSKVSPYWKITGYWVDEDTQEGAMIGAAVAERLRLKIGDSLVLVSETTGRQAEFVVKGLVKTGSTEDNQVFVNLGAAQKLFELPGKINVAYLSIMGEAEELTAQAAAVSQNYANLNAKPIKRIAQSEGLILEKIKALVYLVVSVILLATLMCVATTMMTMVVERKKEIGLKKALGAPDWKIAGEFLGEALLLAAAGAILGSLVGAGFAQLIGQSVFKAAISLSPVVFLAVLLVSLAVTAVAAMWPVWVAVGVDPAVVLKGE